MTGYPGREDLGLLLPGYMRSTEEISGEMVLASITAVSTGTLVGVYAPTSSVYWTGWQDNIDRTMIAIHLLFSLAPGVSAAFVIIIVLFALVSSKSVTLVVLSTITLVLGVLASRPVRPSFVSEEITDGSDELLNRMAL